MKTQQNFRTKLKKNGWPEKNDKKEKLKNVFLKRQNYPHRADYDRG